MYSVNGVALDNDVRGWSVQASTRALLPYSPDVTVLRVPSMDGHPSLPSFRLAPRVTFVLRSPRSGLADLYALLTAPGSFLSLTADTSKRVGFEVLSIDPVGLTTSDELVELTVVLSLFGAAWRDATETISSAAALGSASVVVSVFPNISAPVTDARVVVAGSFAGLRVTDSGGSWFSYSGSVPSGKWLSFVPARNFATVGPANNWDDFDSEASGSIDFGGPRGIFEITPYFSSDPSVRTGRLTVTTTSRSGASVQVRGKGAYLV